MRSDDRLKRRGIKRHHSLTVIANIYRQHGAFSDVSDRRRLHTLVQRHCLEDRNNGDRARGRNSPRDAPRVLDVLVVVQGRRLTALRFSTHGLMQSAEKRDSRNMADAARAESDTQLEFTYLIDIRTQSRGQHDRQQGAKVRQGRGMRHGRDRGVARCFRIHGRQLHEALQCDRERAHSYMTSDTVTPIQKHRLTRIHSGRRIGKSRHRRTYMRIPTVDGSASKVRDLLVYNGPTTDSQFEPARGTESISRLVSIHCTPKLARLDVPQSRRTTDVEHHEQIMFLATTIMKARQRRRCTRQHIQPRQKKSHPHAHETPIKTNAQFEPIHGHDHDRAIHRDAQCTSTQWTRVFFLLAHLHDVQQWGYKLDKTCAEFEVPEET